MGFRGTSPKQMKRMMKKMGIEQTEVSGAKEVIIRFADNEWVIAEPQVVMIKSTTGESFQISGAKIERPIGTKGSLKEHVAKPIEIEIPVEDAALVASQTSVSIEVATEALKESDGDLAAAILKLRRA